jgi:hypothetical protein
LGVLAGSSYRDKKLSVSLCVLLRRFNLSCSANAYDGVESKLITTSRWSMSLLGMTSVFMLAASSSRIVADDDWKLPGPPLLIKKCIYIIGTLGRMPLSYTNADGTLRWFTCWSRQYLRAI